MKTRTCLASLVTLSALAFGSSASAVSIGIDIQATSNGGQPAMALNEVAGVVAQANWNSLTAGSNGGGSLINNLGVVTAASIAWTPEANFTISGAGNNAPGDVRMMNGYLDQSDGSVTVTISNIPFATYDIYIYADGDTADRTFGYTGTGSSSSTINLQDTANFTTGSSFVVRTSSGVGNVAQFTSQTSPTFTIVGTGVSGLNRAPISGIQIVDTTIPEPATLSLLGLGSLALLRRRRALA